MALHPQIARILPQRLRQFCEALKYPHTFLASLLGMVLTMVLGRVLPHAQEVLVVFAIVLFSSSKIRRDD